MPPHPDRVRRNYPSDDQWTEEERRLYKAAKAAEPPIGATIQIKTTPGRDYGTDFSEKISDVKTGIAIKFVQQYHVEKDKDPTAILNEYGVDEGRAWERAKREETDEARSCGRPYSINRAYWRWFRFCRP